MKKKLMTLMMGTLLLLTACGQMGSNSASTMLPVAAVQSAAQAIAPVEGKTQDDAESLPAGEDTEKAESAGGEETPKPVEDTETPSGKTEETPPTPTGEKQPDVPEQPTVPEQAEIPAPQPEPAPTEPEPTPAPVQEPEPTPAPNPNPNLSRSMNRQIVKRLSRRPTLMLPHSTASPRTVA